MPEMPGAEQELENVQAFKACIPSTLASTLKALKYDVKLDKLLQEYIAPSSSKKGSSDASFEKLEKQVRPILVDVGAGKKGAAEILDKWRDKLESRQVEREVDVKRVETTGDTAEQRKDASLPPNKAAESQSSSKSVTSKGKRGNKTVKETENGSDEGHGHNQATAAPEGFQLSSLLAELPPIHATSQESRFYLDDIVTNTQEVDLKTLNISIPSTSSVTAEKELLVDAHLRLKQGVHYVLFGRNGSGKSTLLRALGERLIPGLPPKFTILLVSQLENELFAAEVESQEGGEEDGKKEGMSTLRSVLMSDKARVRALQETEALGKVLDAADDVDNANLADAGANADGREEDDDDDEDGALAKLAEVVAYMHLARRRDELEEAKRFSLRRSGARGADARKALIQAEKDLEEARRVHQVLADRGSTPHEGRKGFVMPPDMASRDWRAEAADLYASAQSSLEELEQTTAEARCESILKGLGFSSAQIYAPYKTLSGGWKSRASLASALLKQADCLLLDEPSNYLDLPAVLFLQNFIQASPKTMVLVSHDRELVDNVAEELIVLRKQKLTYFDGNLTEYEETQRRKLKSALKQQAALDKKKEHIERSIAEGARQAKKHGDDNKMRMVKSRQRKLDDRWGLEVNAKGHRFKLNRDLAGYHLTTRAGIDVDVADADINFSFPDPESLRFPGPLVHLDHVTLEYPRSGRPAVSDVTLTIHEGERVAFVGPNGHGKTTTINLIMERLSPTSGHIERHSKATIRYYDQHTIEQFAQLSRSSASTSGKPITALSHFLEKITGGDEAKMAGMEGAARRFLGGLGLKGRTADAQPLHSLSGGQAVRLGLAEVMWDEPHLICLDEVTQHLDADSIEALIRALKSFKGAILLVSHDRHAVKLLIEGKHEDVEDSSDEEQDRHDEDELSPPGRVYWVNHGKFKLLSGGMDSYVAQVEKALNL